MCSVPIDDDISLGTISYVLNKESNDEYYRKNR